jgi:NADPH:quinone reductase-like Zn-dependent oxidoreductase
MSKSLSSINKAAYLDEVGKPLDVREAPYTTPNANMVVIKVHAWAINPADVVVASVDLKQYFPHLTFPTILGIEVAGEVHEIGSGVNSFQKGDRVMAAPLAFSTDNKAEGGFQEYTMVHAVLTSKIPNSLSYADACVFPLTSITAAMGLFEPEWLGLDYPDLNLKPKRNGKIIFVWGGSSSVGCNTIQLAVAAGCTVYASASPHNFAFLKKLGVTKCFNYNSETVDEDVLAAIDAVDDFVGLFVATGSIEKCLNIAARSKKDFFLPTSQRLPPTVPNGVKAKFIFSTVFESVPSLQFVFGKFLPKVLAEGKWIVAPEPLVIGKGLGDIQKGIHTLAKGVSAKKVIIVSE